MENFLDPGHQQEPPVASVWSVQLMETESFSSESVQSCRNPAMPNFNVAGFCAPSFQPINKLITAAFH